MRFTASPASTLAAETPMKTSAPAIASLSLRPAMPRTAWRRLKGLRSVRSSLMTPFESHIVTSSTPAALSISQMRMPAAPAPFMTTLSEPSERSASMA